MGCRETRKAVWVLHGATHIKRQYMTAMMNIQGARIYSIASAYSVNVRP